MINQTTAKEKNVFLLTDSNWHARMIQFIVGVLMLALYVWIAAGVASLLFNLPEILKNGWTQIAEHIIVDIVLILAILELVRILQSYLSVGRVKFAFGDANSSALVTMPERDDYKYVVMPMRI